MTRARDIANLATQAGSGLDASDITTGVLPVGVTGGSGLTHLASNPTVTLGSNATFPAGHIKQIVQTVLTTGSAVSNDSNWNDISGLSVSITPSSSSHKVLVIVHMIVQANGDSYARLMRDSTPIAIGTGQAGSQLQTTFGYISNGSYSAVNAPVEAKSVMYLDSPSSTSAIAYHVEQHGTDGTFYVNRSHVDSNSESYGRTCSTITAMEVVA